MIQVYADGELAFDNRMDDYDLQGLKITTGLRIGGTAEIVMPPQHPAYNLFIGYRTVVEVYRDNVLRFRGRALYPVDDFNNQRTVVCEGEFCFLQDGVSRPYLYQASPAEIFAAVIGEYNAQVEPFKRFKVGEITVTDPNDYVRLESNDAETTMATVNKLLERCGGYIVFTTDESGDRVIHWRAQVGKRNSQVVELGENLFDVSRTGANTDLATAVIPYGAKDEATGKRLTIESVNGGKDYIEDAEAVALRGTIFKAVVWDDVTTPENLLQKAEQYLNEHKLIVTSLSLTALDLSYVDRSIDSYEVGDLIHVRSRAHLLDDDFQLVEHSEDLLNPANSNIVLGKETTSLTGADVAAADANKNDIQQLAALFASDVSQVKGEMVLGVATDGTGKKYSYLKSSADYIKFEGDDLEIDTSQFKLDRDGNADFSGTLSAPSGNIGGLQISESNISSGNDGLTFTKDGRIVAQNLEVRDHFQAESLQISKVTGRVEGNAALHFEGATKNAQKITVESISWEADYYYQNHDWLIVEMSEAVPSSVTVAVTFSSSLYGEKTFNVVIPAGEKTARQLEMEYYKTLVSYTPDTFYFETGESTSAILCEGNFSPYEDNARDLGASGTRWNDIWATNGTIQTSDRNKKNTIAPLTDIHGKIFDRLAPVTFKFNENTSDRVHLGLIAQDVKQTLDDLGVDSKNFAAYCEWENEDGSVGCGLRYTELIALTIHEIQKLKARINELETGGKKC